MEAGAIVARQAHRCDRGILESNSCIRSIGAASDKEPAFAPVNRCFAGDRGILHKAGCCIDIFTIKVDLAICIDLGCSFTHVCEGIDTEIFAVAKIVAEIAGEVINIERRTGDIRDNEVALIISFKIRASGQIIDLHISSDTGGEVEDFCHSAACVTVSINIDRARARDSIRSDRGIDIHIDNGVTVRKIQRADLHIRIVKNRCTVVADITSPRNSQFAGDIQFRIGK